MTYATHTIAAAISNITERSMRQEKISDTDTDALGRVVIEAERMVADQLVRQGMALQEAQDLAARAALTPGRDSKESDLLADDAYMNRNAGLPSADVPNAPEAVEERTEDSTPAQTTDAAIAAAVTTQPAAAAPHARTAPPMSYAPPAREPQLLGYDVVMKKVHEIFKGVRKEDHLFDFEVPFINWSGRHGGIPALDSDYSFDPCHLHTVLYAIAEKTSLNLVGPHGCGKTEMILQVAARLNHPVTVLPMDGQMSRRELIGQEKLRATAYGNESYFAAGLLPRALQEPGIILFDEVDRAVSDLQYACHSVYLQKGLTVLEDQGRFIPFHEHNRVFGTSNTKGRGSLDGMYQAAEEMSEATRDRWSIWIDMDYPDAETDASVLLAKVKDLQADQAQVIAGIASDIRAAYKEARLSQTCSMRQQLEVGRKAVFLCRGERDDVRRQKALRHAFDRVIGGRASPEDKGAIENLIQIKMPQAFVGDPFIC